MMTLTQVAELVGGKLVGDGDKVISNLNSIDAAGPQDVTFLVNEKEVARLKECKAGCVLVPENVEAEAGGAMILVKDPNLASAILHNALLETEFEAKGVHPRAYVGEQTVHGELISVGPLAVIGDRVTIGERVTIESGAVIGDDVTIGDDCRIKANVTIAEGCTLGSRVIIHSGTVIGSDGYGYATDPMGNHVKKPQVGGVRIDDDVEIGSNASIDRGAFSDTWIQSGVKIDNQVQIAHNVVVGQNSLLVSQVAIAGSTTLGRNVVLGGKTAVNGHIHIEDQVMAAACSGIHNSLKKKGEVVGGAPVLPIKKWARASAVYNKLPEMSADLRKLKKTVANLQEKLEQ